MTAQKQQKESLTGREPVLAWTGDDPVAYSRAVAALDEAGILSFEVAEHDQFSTIPAISGPGYRVIVSKSDAAQAEKIIRATFPSETQD
jgi:hypothetical protein